MEFYIDGSLEMQLLQ